MAKIKNDANKEEFKEHLLECYNCLGSGIKNNRKCRICGGWGQVISDLSVISSAIKGFGQKH